MTSYIVERLRCANCASTFAAMATASFSTFGAVRYSDGFMAGPTFDPGCALVICPLCKHLSWRSDLESLSSQMDADWFVDESNHDVPFDVPVESRQFVIAMQTPFWRTREEEAYVRTHVWWFGNDARRNLVEAIPPLTTDEEQNLRGLLAVTNGSAPSDALTRAEIHRELGEFEACLAELRKVSDDTYAAIVDELAMLAVARERYVTALSP